MYTIDKIIDLAHTYADAEARAQQGFTNNVNLAYNARNELVSGIKSVFDEVDRQTKAKEATIRLWNLSGKADLDSKELLRNLVNALDNAFISSWQSTHAWQKELDLAREHLKDTENE